MSEFSHWPASIDGAPCDANADDAGTRHACEDRLRTAHHLRVPLPDTSAPAAAADNQFIIHMVSRAYGLPEALLRSPSRCEAHIAEARQVLMYLSHVGCGRSFTEIGEMIGRDRTTAAHACQKIEDMRDDVIFDIALDYLEAALHLRMGALLSGEAPSALCGEK